MRLTFIFFAQLVYLTANCQSPSIQWQKCLGGSEGEGASSISQYSNGDFLVCGSTNSNDGDVAGNHSLNHMDIWITRLDSTGTLLWQRCYGGSGDDGASSMLITSDGGFICAGFTTSIDGDLGGVNFHGIGDYWIFKCDSTGTIQWQSCYGGSMEDIPAQIIQTYEGGCALIGRTNSNDYDVTGLHDSMPSANDIWVTKIDPQGNIEWARCYGGTWSDHGISIALCPDSGYIIAGNTYSNDGDINGNHGAYDYWIAKIDKIGDIQWGKCYGGFFDEGSPAISGQGQIITDLIGGYIFLGRTGSSDGDVTGLHGGQDSWLVKLDSTGAIEWQKCFGGTDIDYGNSVCQIADSTYVILSSTSSTNGDITNNHSPLSDVWMANINLSGGINWQSCFGGYWNDLGANIATTVDGGLILAAGTSSNDGDVSGNHGQFDAWIVKLYPLPDGNFAPVNSANNLSVSLNYGGEILTLRFSVDENEDCRIQFTDVNGQVLVNQLFAATKGVTSKDILVGNLCNGIYFINLITEEGSVTTKFVKY